MNWRIGPWREVAYLREQIKYHETWHKNLRAECDMWRAEWGQMYKALMASQKGCVRLRRRLTKLLQRKDEAT